MILDGVVRPSGDELGNLGPLVAPLLVRVVDYPVLFLGPSGFLDLRVKVVVPALPTLLPDTALDIKNIKTSGFLVPKSS